MTCTAPCPSCPWRKSSTAGGSDIPRFDLEKMRALRSTVGTGDDFRTVMACHYSTEDGEYPCAGYVYRHGYENINVRIMMLDGRLDHTAVEEACADLDLWSDFHSMLTAYEEAVIDHHARYRVEAGRGGMVAICSCGWRSEVRSSGGLVGSMWDLHVEASGATS